MCPLRLVPAVMDAANFNYWRSSFYWVNGGMKSGEGKCHATPINGTSPCEASVRRISDHIRGGRSGAIGAQAPLALQQGKCD